MTGPAGERNGRCAWCGWKLPAHDPACYVPGFVARLREPKAASTTGETSRALFAAAQRAGTTVGHEWGRQSNTQPE